MQSDRSIAKKVKVDGKTVAAVRAEAEDGAEFPHHTERIGADGVAQPAKKARGLRPGAKRRTDGVADVQTPRDS